MPRLKDLRGMIFGELTVISRVLSYVGSSGTTWQCKCSCGRFCEVKRGDLTNGSVLDCQHIQHRMPKIMKCKRLKKNRDWLNSYYRSVMTRALVKNYDFDITIDFLRDLLANQLNRCSLTNWPIRFGDFETGLVATASLDRIDSNKGYTKDNVQWIHKHVNWMKRDHSEAYFIKICQAIADKSRLE